MTQQDSKYVSSSRPVNQRTVSRPLLREQPLNPAVKHRLNGSKARSRFGQPLAEQMKALASGDRRVPLEVLTILGSIVAAISFVGILLAWIQSSGISVVGGLIGVFVGFGLIFRGHFSRNSDTAPVASSPLFDEASLHAFDQMLEKAAIVVPDDIALQLNKIKQLFIRISRQSNGGECDEHFTMDDRMYLIECLRRYLPDSLESYLLIPEQQRKIVAIDGHQTAAMVLGNQLSLILTELEKSESKIVKTAAGKLLRQQRFLESKRS